MGRPDPEEGQLPAPVKPPDGGWGWIVLLGCFVITGFSYAFPKAVSVYFKELMKDFHVGYSDTAWISSIMLAMLYGTGDAWTHFPLPNSHLSHSAIGPDHVPMDSSHAHWPGHESRCRIQLSYHFSSGSVLHPISLFPLSQEISGFTPPTSQTVDTGFGPTPEVLFLSHQAPGNRGPKAGQSRSFHTTASCPWPGPTDVYRSSQVVSSIITVSSSLSALPGLLAPSQLSCLLLVSYSVSSASS